MNFYATIAYEQIRQFMPGVPYLLPASSWARGMRKDGTLPAPAIPAHIPEVAADSGGFVATKIWGDYRYSPGQYVDWLRRWPVHPSWAATMDYCCEEEITGANDGVVCQRQQRTTDMAHLFWQQYRDEHWCWVPTIQGWEVEDYRRHAQQMRPLIYEMRDFYCGRQGSGLRGIDSWRVGIGTLCARANMSTVHQVVRAVVEELPGIPIHLWGVKLSILKSSVALPAVVSVDSAAWHPGGLKSDSSQAKRDHESLTLTQMAHALQIALPRYIRKIEAASSKGKQLTLWEGLAS